MSSKNVGKPSRIDQGRGFQSFDTFNQTQKNLTMIQKLAPKKFSELTKSFEGLQNQDVSKLSTHEMFQKMSLLAVDNRSFLEQVRQAANSLDGAKVKSYRLNQTKKAVKELGNEPSMGVRALSLEKAKRKIPFMKSIYDGKDLKAVRSDIKTLGKALSPKTTITFDANGKAIREDPLSSPKDLKPIDTIIIMGNNDLKQVKNVFDLWEMQPNKKDIQFYISGFGGHGTTPGPIFSKTEAETMQQYLISLGVPKENITIDPDATNSGENVEFLNEKMQENGHQPKHALVSGTPASAMRQIRTIEKQTLDKPVVVKYERLSTFPSDDVKQYTPNETDGMITLLGHLREVVSYMNYSINSPFLPNRPVSNPKEMKEAIILTWKYYEKMNPNVKKLSPEEKNELAAGYVRYLEIKSKGAKTTNEENEFMESFESKYNEQIKEVSAFMRDAFAEVEKEYMPRLSAQLTILEQSVAISKSEVESNPLTRALDLESAKHKKK